MQKIKKILITAEFFYPRTGGIEQYLLELVNYLNRVDVEVVILTSRWSRELPNESVVNGSRVIYSDLLSGSLEDPFSVLKNRTKIEKVIRSISPDVVYSNNHNSLVVVKACKNIGLPCFYGCHGVGLICPLKKKFLKADDSLCWGDVGYSNCTKCFFKNYDYKKNIHKVLVHPLLTIWPKVFKYKNAVRELVTSNGVVANSELCSSLFPEFGNKIGIPLPIELSGDGYYPQKNESVLKKFDLEHKKYILVPGRLNKTKGQKYVLGAIKKLRIGEDIKIVFAGNANLLRDDLSLGEYANEMKEIIQQLSLESRIVFTGFLNKNEMRAIYTSARISVIPSVWIETFGLVAIESIACETPVIITKNTGAKECITPESGRVIDRMSSDDLAKAINDIWDNSIKMGKNGRSQLESKHNWTFRGAQLMNFFEENI